MNASILVSAVRQIVESQQVAPNDQTLAAEILIAQTLAYECPLPAEPVEEPYHHYRVTLKQSVASQLAAVNEQLVLDFPMAEELCYQFWLLRYSLVHRMHYRYVNRFMQCACQALGSELNTEHNRVLNTYPQLGMDLSDFAERT